MWQQAYVWFYPYLLFWERLFLKKAENTGVFVRMTTITEDGSDKCKGKVFQSRADARLFTYLSVMGRVCHSDRMMNAGLQYERGMQTWDLQNANWFSSLTG